ncbi:MAG TPA: DUF6279 family lipoprotein [Burkholderiales bacterium]|nr:DUF6279 family lipoprotein [Burkholderiales bacterium]
MRRALVLLAALAAGAVLSGCSSMRLAYDNADTYLLWRAGSYFDLHGAAGDEFEERIDAFFDWHRANALPQYARLSEEAAKRLSDGLSPDDLVWGYDALMAQARVSLRTAATQIAPLLDRMSAEQIGHLERRLAEDNRKFAKENLRGSEAERRARRAKQMKNRLEDWVGRLTQAQVERVKLYAARTPLTDEFRDRDRKRLQAEVLGMVRKREAGKRLPDLAANWQKGRDPAFVTVNETWRREFYALLLDIDRSLSPAQRAKAVANFRRYAEDFAVLAGQAEPRVQ